MFLGQHSIRFIWLCFMLFLYFHLLLCNLLYEHYSLFTKPVIISQIGQIGFQQHYPGHKLLLLLLLTTIHQPWQTLKYNHAELPSLLFLFLSIDQPDHFTHHTLGAVQGQKWRDPDPFSTPIQLKIRNKHTPYLSCQKINKQKSANPAMHVYSDLVRKVRIG